LATVSPGRFSSWLLVGVAIFVVLGHVCATPFHVHAGAVTTHSEDHPEHESDDGAHGGSCEALRTTANLDVPALPPASITLVPFSDFRKTSAPTTEPPVSTSSPPLFLLHASLLI